MIASDKMTNIYRSTLLIGAACALAGQPVASYKYTVKGDEKTVEISSVNYEVVESKLVLRKTTKSKQVIGDIGTEASSTTEAWPLGTDLKEKPLYSVTVEGTESRTVENELFTVSRGLEEVEWWSVYRLADGTHLFDTYMPLVKFSTSRKEMILRYAGFDVPPDDSKDVRLNDRHVVGVLTYASEAKVIREALLTCEDPKLAVLLRSYADETRTLTQGGGFNSQILRLSFSQNFPAPAATIAVVVPIAGDDLDLAQAKLPPRMHIAVWKR
jgi:hypothetical protein